MIDLPVRLLLSSVIVAGNILSSAAVTAYAAWLLPKGDVADPRGVLTFNLMIVAGFLLVSIPVCVVIGALKFRVPPDDVDQKRLAVIYAPRRLAFLQGSFWFAAAVLFGVVNAQFSVRLGLAIAETVLIVGITSSALSYLLTERILRRSATRVLAGKPPRMRLHAGVLIRSVLFWALGTATPVCGLMMAGLSALIYSDISVELLATTSLVAGGAALVIGFLTTVGAARAVADPVRAVRKAMQQIEQGRMHTSVPVYDVTELGALQAGFNTMAAGLRERERIRELFGRQVGQEVASAAAEASEVRLGGEVRSVAVLFVDLVGSTTLAGERPPTEVVALLNQFFGVVVEVIESNGGWINKFEGDAALAVFGAPNEIPDPAGQALAAGRHLVARLADDVPDLLAGIGISAGDAVAGYVGNIRRYEYTVIGDPVNEAARLTELAKSAPGRILASAAAVSLAGRAEASRWTLGDAVTLRGRTQPTRLAGPSDLAFTGSTTLDSEDVVTS